MDLLFRRYASPFALLDQMIRVGALGEFVELHNEEAREKATWEFFLHKVFDKSYQEFMDGLKAQETDPAPEGFDDLYVETTVRQSKQILGKCRIR